VENLVTELIKPRWIASIGPVGGITGGENPSDQLQTNLRIAGINARLRNRPLPIPMPIHSPWVVNLAARSRFSAKSRSPSSRLRAIALLRFFSFPPI